MEEVMTIAVSNQAVEGDQASEAGSLAWIDEFELDKTGSTFTPVALVKYGDIRVKIYRSDGPQGSNAMSYFYEPIATVDGKNVASSGSQVRFKIQMWNPEVEAKVVDRLRRLPGNQTSPLDVDSVHILPYRDIRLVKKQGVILKNVRLQKDASPYHQMKGIVAFHLLCDSKETADTLAQEIQSDPEYLVQNFALECRWGGSSGATTFGLNFISREEAAEDEDRLELEEKLQREIEILQKRVKGKTSSAFIYWFHNSRFFMLCFVFCLLLRSLDEGIYLEPCWRQPG